MFELLMICFGIVKVKQEIFIFLCGNKIFSIVSTSFLCYNKQVAV